MGTRADFYIGRGQDAEWLGSVAWDGYEWENDDSDLMKAKTPDEFRAAVAAIEAEREDFTTPAEGWPWPWDDSNTSDYAYVFHDGAVTIPDGSVGWLPNMAARKNVQWGSKKGGILVVGGCLIGEMMDPCIDGRADTDDDMPELCVICGGEGVVEGSDHLNWDEDGYDDLIICTSCKGSGLAKDMTWC